MKKRLLAWLLCLCLLAGILPIPAIAAVLQSLPLASNNSRMQVEQSTVTVEYEDATRSAATITYHKEGLDADPFNLIFLVDVSTQGGESYQAFERMMAENGANYIYNYGVGSTVQLIAYQNTAKNTGIMDTESSFMDAFRKHGFTVGTGTANEPVALETAIQAVRNAHGRNDNPTVVFWVLGGKFGETDPTKIEEQLEALDTALGEDDALITWQYADQPSELLTKYATRHNEAHDDPSEEKQPAAHAAADSVLLQERMGADLEEIVHDHYHNIHFSLLLDDEQTLVQEITDARYETDSSMASLTTEIWENGQGMDVTIERLCRQTELDFILEVKLNTGIYEEQTVIPAGAIIADHGGSNGGLHTGIFDEQIEYGLELDLPEAVLDRTAYNITFRGVDEDAGVEDIANKLAGETVVLPTGENIPPEGVSFGGWKVVEGVNPGRHYDPGEIIAMPPGDMVLEPTFGHVEVGLEIGYEQGQEPTTGNRMAPFDFSLSKGNPFDFSGVTLPGGSGGWISIVSVTVVAEEPFYNTIPEEQQDGDPLRVEMTGVEGVVYARHIGATEYDKVVVYLKESTAQPGKYDMYIAGPGGVKAPADCERMFHVLYSTLTSADLSELDVSGVTNMSEMFYWSYTLTEVHADGWDASSVTDMSRMFYHCTALTEVHANGWDASSVTDMSEMFYECEALTTLNVEGWDTSSVTNMSHMFYECFELPKLDASGWDTSSVTDMSSMFEECKDLAELDVSGWKTPSVTNMSRMFYHCRSLQELNVSGWDTSSVTNMSEMFDGCYYLSEPSWRNWDTSSVTDMSGMFTHCVGLKDLGVSSWDTSSVTDMSYMFSECSLLKDPGVSSWNTSSVTDMSGIFFHCSSITNPGVSGWDTSSVTDMSEMFYWCEAIATLDLSGWDTSSVTDMSNMFDGCYGLTELNVSGWDTSSVTDMGGMFGMFRFMGISSLTELDLSDWDTSSVTDMRGMFSDCVNLTKVKGNFDISKIVYEQDSSGINGMFGNCTKLESVMTFQLGESNPNSNFENLFSGLTNLKSVTFITPEKGAEFPQLSTMKGMFQNCSSLTEINLGNWILQIIS